MHAHAESGELWRELISATCCDGQDVGNGLIGTGIRAEPGAVGVYDEVLALHDHGFPSYRFDRPVLAHHEVHLFLCVDCFELPPSWRPIGLGQSS